MKCENMRCESFRQLSDTTKHVCRFGDGAHIISGFHQFRTGNFPNWREGLEWMRVVAGASRIRKSFRDFLRNSLQVFLRNSFRYFLNNANSANVSVSVYWEAEFKVIRKKLTKRR